MSNEENDFRKAQRKARDETRRLTKTVKNAKTTKKIVEKGKDIGGGDLPTPAKTDEETEGFHGGLA